MACLTWVMFLVGGAIILISLGRGRWTIVERRATYIASSTRLMSTTDVDEACTIHFSGLYGRRRPRKNTIVNMKTTMDRPASIARNSLMSWSYGYCRSLGGWPSRVQIQLNYKRRSGNLKHRRIDSPNWTFWGGTWKNQWQRLSIGSWGRLWIQIDNRGCPTGIDEPNWLTKLRGYSRKLDWSVDNFKAHPQALLMAIKDKMSVQFEYRGELGNVWEEVFF